MRKRLSFIKNRYAPKGSFRASVLTLMTGVTIAQIIPIVISPILTRIYSPKDFGVFAVYLSITSIITIFSTGQYESAVMLPEQEEDAINIVILAIIICLFISLTLFLLFFIFKAPIVKLLGNPEIAPWLYFVPLTVLFTSAHQAFFYWLNRKKEYKRLAVNKILQSLIIIGINLGLGFAGWGVSGLIIGNIFGQFFACLILGWRVCRENMKQIMSITTNKFKKLAARYRKFPLYTMPTEFVNVVSNEAPNVLLSSFFGSISVGYYGLTQRVLGVSVSLISTSVYNVFWERASSDYRKNGNCKDIYIKTFKSLFFLSFVAFLMLFFTAPWLFSLVFGEGWRTAGIYAQILSVMLFLRLIVRPLSCMFVIAEKQKENFILQIYLCVSSLICLFLGFYIFRKIEPVLILFSINYSAVYLIYLLFSYSFSKGKK